MGQAGRMSREEGQLSVFSEFPSLPPKTSLNPGEFNTGVGENATAC